MLIQDVASEAFRTQSTERGTTYFVRLDGCLDLETNPDFVRYLATLTPLLKTERWMEVVFDCRTLYLMSSCAISSLATWVTTIQHARSHCQITFETDPNLKWQARTLDSIRRMYPDRISVLTV
jgi:hypothetical protein